MSTLDIKKINLKTIIIFSSTTLFSIIFAGIYYVFSHNVVSLYMWLSFIYSTIGIITYFIMYKKNIFYKWPYNIYNAGLATLTMANIVKGVIEISGADTKYYLFFFILGGIEVLTATIWFIVLRIKERK